MDDNRLIELLIKEVEAAWLSEGCLFALNERESKILQDLITLFKSTSVNRVHERN